MAVPAAADGRSRSWTVAPPDVVPAICEVGSRVPAVCCGMTEKTWPEVPGDEETTDAGGWGENVKVGRDVIGAAE